MKISDFTFNWPLVGNLHITEFLSKSIAKDSIAGTYIFSGPGNLGKTTVALHFAKALLCSNKQRGSGELPCGTCLSCRQFKESGKHNSGNMEQEPESVHGDFHLIKKSKDKKNITIEQIRGFIKMLGMSSFLNSYKIGIIKSAQYLNEEAANALLKTLEEPKLKVVIILITSDIDRLPSTIASRSQIMEFQSVKADVIYNYLIKECKTSRSNARNFSHLCLGRPALAIKFLENEEFYKDYMHRLNVIMNFFKQDINERFSAIATLFGREARGQEAVESANRIIEVWQGLVRDLTLLQYGHKNLIQHQVVGNELFKIRPNSATLLDLANRLDQAKQYIYANVNPKSVIENLAMNI